MRKVILSVALLLVSGVLTSCTDVSEDNIQEKEELEIQNTGGEEDQDPEEDPDSKGASTKGRTESIDTGGGQLGEMIMIQTLNQKINSFNR